MNDLVMDAIENAGKPGLTKEKGDDAVSRLAKLSPMEYEGVRDSEAKKLKVRVKILDSQVTAKRKKLKVENDDDELTQGIKPWPESVDGVYLVDEIRGVLNRYCVLPEGADVALSLWAVASYGINSFRIFPKACLSSPEKRCGKTTTLEVIGALAHRTLMASNISSSVFLVLRYFKWVT